MKTLISAALCAIIIFIMYRSITNMLFKNAWFSNLKPGDKIKVRIFSDSCECKREATVINVPENAHIEAKIDDIDKCLNCAKIKALTKSGMDETSCWSNVNQFHKRNVFRIK